MSRHSVNILEMFHMILSPQRKSFLHVDEKRKNEGLITINAVCSRHKAISAWNLKVKQNDGMIILKKPCDIFGLCGKFYKYVELQTKRVNIN